MTGVFALYSNQLYGLYERWRLDNNREWGAAALAQNIVMAHFRIEDNWCPTFEQPPDDGERKKYRIDVFLLQFGLQHATAPGLLCPKLLIEIKGGGGSPLKVEEQALANAQASIRQYDLSGIYVQTIIAIELNLCFRFWWLEENLLALRPIINSGYPSGTHDGYIPLDLECGAVLDECYDLVKKGDPGEHGLRAQQVPEGSFSQPDLHGQYGYGQDQYYQSQQAGPSSEGYNVNSPPVQESFAQEPVAREQQFDNEQGQQHWTYETNPPNEGYDVDMAGPGVTVERADEADVASDSDEEEQAAEAGAYGAQDVSTAKRQRKEKNTTLVEITKETHYLKGKPTEYFFREEGADEDTRTFERHWSKKRSGGGEKWTYKKDKRYWGWKP